MVAAAALAPHTSTIRVGVELAAGVNPVYLAEEAAVADLVLGGRLVLAVGSPDAGLLAETTDVLLAATAARPFRHVGDRWRIPANLPANTTNPADRVRVTPATAQLELPIWLTGPHGPRIARERCLTFVGAAKASVAVLATQWARAEEELGLAVNRLRRVAERELALGPSGALDDEAIVASLRGDQREWGMDVVLVRPPAQASMDARLRAIEELAATVMPRVQLDALPPGLEQYWKQRQEAAT
jgi:alkanesulfonate monooxygenase SsuD/methylene tetrahydromethanopterin reductase-like flavin-dependent oxidoreductase (luciferase family)